MYILFKAFFNIVYSKKMYNDDIDNDDINYNMFLERNKKKTQKNII